MFEFTQKMMRNNLQEKESMIFKQLANEPDRPFVLVETPIEVTHDSETNQCLTKQEIGFKFVENIGYNRIHHNRILRACNDVHGSNLPLLSIRIKDYAHLLIEVVSNVIWQTQLHGSRA